MTEWKDGDFIAADKTYAVIKSWRRERTDELGRHVTWFEVPVNLSKEEREAVEDMERVSKNVAEYNRENPAGLGGPMAGTIIATAARAEKALIGGELDD